jgi:hypothetical protein
MLVTQMASGLFSKELHERELFQTLLGHAAQMDSAITTIVSTVDQVNASQGRVSSLADEVEQLGSTSFDDIKTTNEVVETIPSIAGLVMDLKQISAASWP